MNLKSTLLGMLTYTLVTFPLAVIWHVLIFKDAYTEFGYFQGEPSFTLGLVTIIIQGCVLSFLYPYVSFGGSSIIRGLKFSLLIGVFFWSSHVLAFIAKQIVINSFLFVAMETFYLLFQFGIYGVLIGLIYSKTLDSNA